MSTEEQIQGKLSLDSISEYYDKNKNNVMIKININNCTLRNLKNIYKFSFLIIT